MNARSASWPWDLTPFYARNVLIRKHRLQLKASLSPDFFLKISGTPTLEKGGYPLAMRGGRGREIIFFVWADGTLIEKCHPSSDKLKPQIGKFSGLRKRKENDPWSCGANPKRTVADNVATTCLDGLVSSVNGEIRSQPLTRASNQMQRYTTRAQ